MRRRKRPLARLLKLSLRRVGMPTEGVAPLPPTLPAAGDLCPSRAVAPLRPQLLAAMLWNSPTLLHAVLRM